MYLISQAVQCEQLLFETCRLYLVRIVLDVASSGCQTYGTRDPTDLDSPRLARRVERSFEPAQVTLLIFVIEVDDGSLVGSSSYIDINRAMTPHVSSSDSDTLRLVMHESLQTRM